MRDERVTYENVLQELRMIHHFPAAVDHQVIEETSLRAASCITLLTHTIKIIIRVASSADRNASQMGNPMQVLTALFSCLAVIRQCGELGLNAGEEEML